jgi:hypothetical protein
MNLSSKIEGDERVKAMLKQLGTEAKHAVRMAANSIGEHMQGAMRREIPNRFTFRGTSAGFKDAIVFSKAIPGRTSRANAILRVGSDSPGGSRTKMLGRILARHETAETRTSSESVRLTAGGTRQVGFFIPANSLRTKTSGRRGAAVIPMSLFPKAIGASMRRTADGSYIYAKSVRKTTKKKVGERFVITEKGIFRQRFVADLRKHDMEPIWWFSKHVKTPARLRLWETADKVFDRFSLGYLDEAIDTVLARLP